MFDYRRQPDGARESAADSREKKRNWRRAGGGNEQSQNQARGGLRGRIDAEGRTAQAERKEREREREDRQEESG